jgi:hypothetical protein
VSYAPASVRRHRIEDGSSNPEATSDLQSSKDCIIVRYDTTTSNLIPLLEGHRQDIRLTTSSTARLRNPSAASRFPHA